MKDLLDFLVVAFDEGDSGLFLNRDWDRLVHLDGVGTGLRSAGEALDRVLGAHLRGFL